MSAQNAQNGDGGEEKTSVAVVDDSVSPDEHEKVQPPTLLLLSGSETLAGKQWFLNQPKLILGRSPSSDIQISDPCVSKIHARFSYDNGEVSVTDLGATNTTMINNVGITPHQAVVLKNNDLIRTGTLIFKFLKHGILSESQEKSRMQDELESARTIQATLLPSNHEANYEWVQINGRYRAAAECGGDWWWHWSKGQKAYAIIADATGHGAPAALLTSAARSAISTVEDRPNVPIETVYLTLSHSISKISGGKLTMSAFLIEIDLVTRQLRYIVASHPPAIVLPHDASNVRWNQLRFLMEPLSHPFGASNEAPQVGTLTAQGKTRLVLLTDGLIERPNREGTPLNESAFTRGLLKAQIQHPNSQDKFLDAVFAHSDEWAQSPTSPDDLTAVTLDFR